MTRTKTPWTAALAGLVLAASAGAAFAQQAAPNAAIPNALNAIRPNEIQQAQQQNPQVIEQFGGTVDPRLNGYVAAVGRKIAAQTGVSGGTGAFTVTVLNSPVRNAFSVPGGYVYVTRELLAMMNDEAELGFVLGHEMGHVVARHSQSRQTRSTISSIGAALAGIVSGSDLVGQLAGTVGQGLVLGYSRSQENEADKLGVRFAARAGYDAFAAPRILGGLGQGEAYDSLEGGTAATAPSWTRSHPLSQDRVVRTTALARQLPAPGTVASHNREQYLSAIEGMRYGDDPQQGVVEGNRFLHPGLRLAFTAPSGYTLQNGASEVQIAGKGGQATFGSGKFAGDLTGYVGQVFQSLSNNQKVDFPAPATTTVNGMPAAYATIRASSGNTPIDATVFAYRWSATNAYHFLLITPAGSGIGPFEPMVQSLAPLGAAEAAAVRGRAISVVTVGPRDTVQTLGARMAYTKLGLERFLMLNGLDANSRLRPGQKVKLVVFRK